MNEKQFLRIMIEAVKYDDEFQNKDEILSILRYSIVNFRSCTNRLKSFY